MNALTAGDFDFFRKLVFQRAAIVLEPNKQYLVESRMDALARKEGIASGGDIIRQLRAANDPVLTEKAVDAMTTNETSFFRDPHYFEGILQTVLPAVAERNKGRVKIWCAACSSGQEPYSLAMLIRENLPSLVNRYEILATDLSAETLKTAGLGKYTQVEINRGLPAAFLARYFEKKGLRWQIKAELQRSITFKQMNLIEAWTSVPQVDVVLMRNVLIYFDSETKSAILKKVRQVLRPGGYMLLGATENTWGLDRAFKRQLLGKAVAYQV